MALKSFNFAKVAVSVGGRPITGFADGEAITVERNEDAFSLLVGADGEATRAKSNNRSGRITLRLLQTSESNLILNDFAQADEVGDAGLVPVFIKDASGNSIYTAEQAWVVKRPSAAFGAEAGDREWVLETDNLVMREAGN